VEKIRIPIETYRSKKSGNKRFLVWLTLCVLLSLSISCQRKIIIPAGIPETFSQTGTEKLPEKWWTALDDPKLSELIETALKGNLNLQATWDRLEQSRAIARKSGADLKPSVDATAGFTQSMTKAGGKDANFTDQFSLGVVASYEVDLWGRVSSASKVAEQDLLVSQEDLHASAISLSAEVATVWYKLVEQRGQIALLKKQIKNHEDHLEIVTIRFRQGQVSSTDVLQQRQSLEAAREAKIRVESNAKISEHRLAVLMGKAPGTISIPEDNGIPNLPPLPETGLPAHLLHRRPDIISAYLKVRAADYRIAVAIANRYPRISLSASISTTGSSDTGDARLFENWLATLAGNLLLPIFDAGSRAAEVDRTKAARSELFYRYGEATLNALKEVEDALIRERHQITRLESLDKQYELSVKSVGLTRERYTHGVTDFLRFLTTLLNHHSLERNRLTSKRELVEYRINLYRALGGSWEMNRTKPKTRHYIIEESEHNGEKLKEVTP
jgi:NodT family efflux transporter outer membrane factor (OMF) lipoprotein